MSDKNQQAALRDAYAKLDEAIQRVCELEADGESAHLVDWVVITASQFFQGDDAWSRTNMLIDPAANTPFYRILGLLEFALTRARAECLRDDD